MFEKLPLNFGILNICYLFFEVKLNNVLKMFDSTKENREINI